MPVAPLVAVLLVLATPAANSEAVDNSQATELFSATSRHPFDEVEHWRRVFDDPSRGAWQKPAEGVGALGLAKGMTVADLGAGTGYFNRYLSVAVGVSGTVLALETEPNLVAFMLERAERELTANVIPVLTSFDRPRLPRAGLDLVLIVNTYHHLDQRRDYLDRLRPALKEGGRIAIIEWRRRPLPVGPPLDHKLARDQVLGEMKLAGFGLLEEPDFLPHQYFLVFGPRSVD